METHSVSQSVSHSAGVRVCGCITPRRPSGDWVADVVQDQTPCAECKIQTVNNCSSRLMERKTHLFCFVFQKHQEPLVSLLAAHPSSQQRYHCVCSHHEGVIRTSQRFTVGACKHVIPDEGVSPQLCVRKHTHTRTHTSWVFRAGWQ